MTPARRRECEGPGNSPLSNMTFPVSQKLPQDKEIHFRPPFLSIGSWWIIFSEKTFLSNSFYEYERYQSNRLSRSVLLNVDANNQMFVHREDSALHMASAYLNQLINQKKNLHQVCIKVLSSPTFSSTHASKQKLPNSSLVLDPVSVSQLEFPGNEGRGADRRDSFVIRGVARGVTHSSTHTRTVPISPACVMRFINGISGHDTERQDICVL